MISSFVLHGNSSPVFALVDELRRTCWKSALPNLDDLHDGHDEHAFHFVLLEQEKVIAASRLCVHTALAEVPDPHLYANIDTTLPALLACLNRLVVHPDYRGKGLAATLDQARTQAACTLGCNSLLVIWNEHSGSQRRKAIEAQGFVSLNNGAAVDDGAWGDSYPYAKRLEGGVQLSETCNINGYLQVFSAQLQGVLGVCCFK